MMIGMWPIRSNNEQQLFQKLGFRLSFAFIFASSTKRTMYM